MARKTEHFDYHVGLGAGLYANSSLGAAGQVLKSDGTNVYWGNDSSSGGDAATLDGYDSTAFALLAAENVFTLKQTINLNTSTAASPGTTGVTLHLSGSDGVTTRLWLDSYGVATNYTARRTNGTNAAKTALLAADIIMNNSAFGYDGVAYSTSSRGSMQIRASQNWAVGAHGTRLVMLTTADSTTTQTERWVFEQDGSLIYSGGSATGNGTVNANDYFDNGVNINTIYLASASYTAADVLSKLLTVDGSGSGLDADLLDGQQGSAYALVGSSNIFSATQSIQISGGLSALTIGHTAASSSSQLILRGDAATYRMAFFNTGAAARFAYGVDNVAESGSNAGSNFFFQSYDDAGTFLGTILTANRNTRVVSFGQTPTVSSSTMWHAGNDGAGSGLDADLLDGNSSAYYLAASTYTAADVLSKLLTVDGAGSGLDADLLDGKNTGTSGNVVGLLDGNNTYSGTSTFTNTVNATHTTNGAPNIRWGSLDAISSDTSANALFGRNAYYDATAATYKIYATSIGGWGLIKVGGDTLQFSGASGSVTAGTSITPTWYNIWHENNDGSGSGLDADLWDGNQFSTYLNQAVLSTSSPVFSALRLTLSTGRQFYIRQWADFSDNYSGYAVMGANLYSQPDTSTYITPNTHASVGYAAIRMMQNTIQFAGFSGATTAGATVTPTWNTVWHAGNDGAGSGLDADLWDGNQFASYLNQAVLTSSGPTFAGLTSTASIQTTGVAEALRIRNDSGYISVFDSANSTRTGYIQFNTGSTLVMHNEATNGALNLRTTGSGVVQINGNTAWHAGNDGAGSGLDADLLDGNNIGTSGTAVPLLSGTNTWGGNQTFSGQITLGGSGTRYAIFDSNDYIEYAGASDQWAIRIGNTAYLTLTASLTNVISTSLQHNGNTVWTAANDGSGSGLDADLLDGYNVGTSGGTIPLLNGNNTYSGTSSFTGAVTISRGAVPLQITTTVDNGNVEGFILEGDRATPSANDIVYMNWRLSNSAGTQTEFGRQSIVASTVTAASEASYWMWSVRSAGTLTSVMRLTASTLAPHTSDGLALGDTTLMWSDIFLASGAVVNFNNGDVTVTHSTNTLAFAGASSGYTFDAAVSATGLNLNSATSFLPQAIITNTNNDANAGYVIFYKTPADTTVTANDYLGTILWYGHGSSSASGTAATIYARAEGTRGTDWVASNLVLASMQTSGSYRLLSLNADGTITWNSGAVWHAGNDGSGSGLDADLLDGNNIGTSGAAVPLLNGVNTWSGKQTFSATGAAVVISSAEPRQDFYQTDAGADAKLWSFIGDGNNFYLQTRTDADVFGVNAFQLVRSGTTISTIAFTSTAFTWNGNTVWSSGNDGAGSGLDADLLDGLSSAAFAQLSVSNVFTLLQTINTNTSTAASPGTTGVLLHLSGADATVARLWLDSYGAATNYTARRANGTNAAKTALLADDVIMNNTAFGHDGTAYSTGTRGAMQIRASQNWAVGAHGTRIVFLTVPDGSTTQTTRWIVEQDGSLIYSGGTATGASTVNAVDYFDNGVNINTIYLASSSYTAADVLSKLLTVDGAGSGLDADLLDGYNVGTSGGAIPLMNGTNTWSGNQTITTTGTGSPLTLTSTDAGASAFTFDLYRNSASPAASDAIAAIRFRGENSTPATVTYGAIQSSIADTTAASEDAYLYLQTMIAGTLTNALTLGYASNQHRFTAPTDMVVAAVGANGYGSFYAIGSGTNNSYMFFGNATSGERSRITANNSRDFIISNDGGVTNHLSVNSSGTVNVKSGFLTLGTASNPRLTIYNTAGTAATVVIGADSGTGWIGTTTSSQFSLYANSTERLRIPTSGSLLRDATYTIWDSSNDGPGSGLDADLLDGLNSTQFLRSDLSQQGGFTYATHDFNTYPSVYSVSFVNPTGSSNLPTGMTSVMSYRFIMAGGDTTARGVDLVAAAESSGNLYFRERSIGTWSKFWHNNNDGAGSGLDADLLDGYNVGTSGGAIPLMNGTNTWSGTQTMSALTARVTLTTAVSGTLTSAHANISVELNGNVTLNNSVFTAGDKTVFDPGTSNRTFTRGAGVTMYVNGTDSATATLAANQIGGMHWRSASVVILTGAFT